MQWKQTVVKKVFSGMGTDIGQWNSENRRYFMAMRQIQTTMQGPNKNRQLNARLLFHREMSIHTHRMSKKQRCTTSDIEPRRRQQKTHVLGCRKSYEAKSRLLVKKRYSLMIYRALSNLCPG